MAPYGTNWIVKWFVSGKAKAAASTEAAKAEISPSRKSTSTVGGNTTSTPAEQIKNAEGNTANAADTIAANTEQATESAANTTVDKVKNAGRPSFKSHDSNRDKFKHAFGLDHKQHKAEAAAASTGSNGI